MSFVRKFASVTLPLIAIAWTSNAAAAQRFVALTGADGGNDCSTQATPCKTITQGIKSMKGGDELIVSDGTYAESIVDMPKGTAAAYTTIRAEHDWGVTIDGSAFSDTFKNGITVGATSYVIVRGFHVKMNQATQNNQPIIVNNSDHVKIQRCSGTLAPTDGNAGTINVGPMSNHILIEESYAFGGGRYQIIVYQSDHVIVRRSVVRNDYWKGGLQCAGFVNYDSLDTLWQNNIVLDTDDKDCTGHLYGGFFNENKPDTADDTSEKLQGNIVLNVQAFYAGDLDWVISGTRTIEDMVIWGSSGGYWGAQGPGAKASIAATRMTIGKISGTYDGPNDGAARGTGFSVYDNTTNTMTSSALVSNNSLGVADYTSSDYNAFSGNGKNYGGTHPAVKGAHDLATENSNAIDITKDSLHYLPRIEAGSPLKTAGAAGGQIGAEIVFKTGATGTLYDEPGFDTITTEPLWPFPNEDQIATDMRAYAGPGGAGARGFTTGNSLDGTPQTLTKYVWEALGNPIPADVYGFHIAVDSLPNGAVGSAYSTTVSVGGGTSPYAWTVTGALPPGLAIDGKTGIISGTPSVVGVSSFTVSVTDAQTPAENVQKPLSITIGAAGTLLPDGGTPPGAGGDGGVNGDGGANAAGGGGDDSGCGCHVPGGSSPGTGGTTTAMLVVGGLAMIGFASRRRRRR